MARQKTEKQINNQRRRIKKLIDGNFNRELERHERDNFRGKFGLWDGLQNLLDMQTRKIRRTDKLNKMAKAARGKARAVASASGQQVASAKGLGTAK